MSGRRYSFLELLQDDPGTASTGDATQNLTWLPGYPDIRLADLKALSAFLEEDLECKDLDKMSKRLWLMTKQDSGNISWLHRQKVKGREVIPTEEPKLHLIWFYDKIYIKPLPRYLLSRHVWEKHLLDHERPLGLNHEIALASALGFLRSYAHLIAYESDFRLATNKPLALLPEYVTWRQWRLLRARLLDIRDAEVSNRFRFGEIRLTRLNFYGKFLLLRPYYHRTHLQYGDYFASFYPPLLFMFGIVSVMLGSMQLAATVEQLDERWGSLLYIFRMSSALSMFVIMLLLVTLMALFAVKITNEWIFAFRCRYSLAHR